MKYRYSIISVLVLVLLFGCKASENKITELKQVKQTNEEDFSYTEMIKVLDNKLFVQDYDQARIICYDFDLNKLKTIGSKGKGPKEFMTPRDIAILPNKKFLVNDLMNLRLATVNYEEALIENTQKYSLAINIENDEVTGKVYLQRYPRAGNSGIFGYNNGEIKKKVNLDDFAKEFEIEEPLEIYNFAVIDDNFFIVFYEQNRIFKQNKNGQKSEIILKNLPPKNYKNVKFGTIRNYKNGLLMPYVVHTDYPKADEVKNLFDKFKRDFYFLSFDFDGNVKDWFLLKSPKNEFTFYEEWDVHNNSIFVYDSHIGEMVKYEIPN